MTTLGDIASLSYGAPISTIAETPLPLEEGQQVPPGASLFVTGSDFSKQGFLEYGAGRITWLTAKDRERFSVDFDRDLLYLTKGYGHRACLPPAGLKCDVVPNNNFVRIRIETSEVLPSYLFSYLNSKHALRFGESRLIGDTLPNLSIKDLAQMPVKIPTLSEQRLFVRLAELQQASTNLTSQLQDLYSELTRGTLDQLINR
jgi:hypothetical protein